MEEGRKEGRCRIGPEKDGACVCVFEEDRVREIPYTAKEWEAWIVDI